MYTVIKKAYYDSRDSDMLNEAGNVILRGGLVAFPTETVYGLGGDAFNAKSARSIYDAKGRPSDNPLIVHISHYSAIGTLSHDVTPMMKKMLESLWPGPLTVILPKRTVVPDETTGGLDTIAIRMPAHPVALRLIDAGGGYIAAPSANTSGRPSPTKVEHVIEDLNGKISMIIDGGPCDIGIESTILDLSRDRPEILRPGYISARMLRKYMPNLIYNEFVDGDEAPRAPGMRYRHYAPNASMTIVSGDEDNVVRKINDYIANHHIEGKRVGVIATNKTYDRYVGDYIVNIGNKDDMTKIAATLYTTLRDFDNAEVDVIYSEALDNGDIGLSIMNRLLKASQYCIEQV